MIGDEHGNEDVKEGEKGTRPAIITWQLMCDGPLCARPLITTWLLCIRKSDPGQEGGNGNATKFACGMCKELRIGNLPCACPKR